MKFSTTFGSTTFSLRLSFITPLISHISLELYLCCSSLAVRRFASPRCPSLLSLQSLFFMAYAHYLGKEKQWYLWLWQEGDTDVWINLNKQFQAAIVSIYKVEIREWKMVLMDHGVGFTKQANWVHRDSLWNVINSLLKFCSNTTNLEQQICLVGLICHAWIILQDKSLANL